MLRRLLAAAIACLPLVATAAREFIDDAGRKVMLPDKVEPVWDPVTAVRRKRVYLSPHLPFGWFDFPPCANRLIGLPWLSEILYPDLFRHDLRRETSRFHELFYHRKPTDAQLDALLAEPGVAPR